MNELEGPTPDADGHDTVIEVLGTDYVTPEGPSVRLTGDAARDVIDMLGAVAKGAVGVHERANALYRVSPSPEMSKLLADGSMRWATPRKGGDATVLIKNSQTGLFAGRGNLVGPDITKVVGPAVWQAMALVTQQHYLVSIDRQLASIVAGFSELVAQNREERLGTLDAAARLADRVLDAVREGRRVSSPAVMQLAAATHTTDEKVHELLRQAERHAQQFADDDGKPGEVEKAWAELLYALQVLSRCSLALVSLPHSNADELDAITAEERHRVNEPIRRALTLSGELLASDADAREAWELRKTYELNRRAWALETATLMMPVAGIVAYTMARHGGAGRRFGGLKGHEGVLTGALAAMRGLTPPKKVTKRKLEGLAPGTIDTLHAVKPPVEEAPLMLVAVHADGSVEISAVAG